MKKIFRMIVFSALALYITSLWNNGFILNPNLLTFIKATVTLAVVYYLVIPISKLILLPLNIITLGLVSFLLYLFILHIASSGFSLFEITDWVFDGSSFLGVNIGKTHIGYFGNLILSSISISGIINILEEII